MNQRQALKLLLAKNMISHHKVAVQTEQLTKTDTRIFP